MESDKQRAIFFHTVTMLLKDDYIDAKEAAACVAVYDYCCCIIDEATKQGYLEGLYKEAVNNPVARKAMIVSNETIVNNARKEEPKEATSDDVLDEVLSMLLKRKNKQK